MEWEFINSVTILLAKIVFENLGCNMTSCPNKLVCKKMNLSANNIFLYIKKVSAMYLII
jgi:uncharacterized protein (UPF0179 family)